MPEPRYTILDSWPGLKHDLVDFLSDTDAWTIAQLRKAYKAKDWTAIQSIIEVMESVHSLSHAH
jgi:hypothetical protein